MDDRERMIRDRAYAIWEREGRPEGREREHWEQARGEVEGERGSVAEDAEPSASGAGSIPGVEHGGTTRGGTAVGEDGTGKAKGAGKAATAAGAKRPTAASAKKPKAGAKEKPAAVDREKSAKNKPAGTGRRKTEK